MDGQVKMLGSVADMTAAERLTRQLCISRRYPAVIWPVLKIIFWHSGPLFGRGRL